jgi:drug/metabolite transporter (DMT)-like permease
MSLFQTAESRTRIALWLMWVTPALWSVNYIVARSAPGVVEPHMLALGRWALAGVILAFVARSELWRERSSTLADSGRYLVLGALGMLICGAWVYQGAKTTSAINIALIYAASPVLIAVGAVLWLGERFSWRQGVGVVVAMAGVFHVVVKGQWLALGQVQWVAGDGWIVVAMVAWAAFSLLQKKWPTPLGSTARLAGYRGVLGLWLQPKGAGCQPRGRQFVPGAFVWGFDRMGLFGRGHGLAPCHGRRPDLARHLPGVTALITPADAIHRASNVIKPIAQQTGCTAGHQAFQMLHGRGLGLYAVQGHFQIAHHARVALGHVPQALVGTAAGQLSRPRIQPNHQLVRQSTGQAPQKHDGHNRHRPQGQPSPDPMGIGPPVEPAIGHHQQGGNPCSQQNRGQKLGECSGRFCRRGQRRRWAEHGGSDGVHFVFPDIEFA